VVTASRSLPLFTHDVPELEWGSEMELAGELYNVCEEYCDALDKLHEKGG
jgi:hypothetical protein